MDPITVTHLVKDRTVELQRTADQVRQERALRSTSSADAIAIAALRPAAHACSHPIGPAKAQPASAKVGGCAPAEPAI